MAVKSNTVLRIVPKKLVSDLTREEQESNPLLLDVKKKSIDRHSSSYELNVIFKGVPIFRRGIVFNPNFNPKYYIGAISAEVSITAIGAEIIDHTKSLSVSVEYTDDTQRGTEGRITVGPEWESKIGKVKLGDFGIKGKQARKSTATFTSEEALLVATVIGETIRWNIDTHRGEKAVRDFLIGNKHLNATFKWKGASRSGIIQTRPEIRYFDSEKRQFSALGSLRMSYRLKQKKFNLDNLAGYELSFSEAA